MIVPVHVHTVRVVVVQCEAWDSVQAHVPSYHFDPASFAGNVAEQPDLEAFADQQRRHIAEHAELCEVFAAAGSFKALAGAPKMTVAPHASCLDGGVAFRLVDRAFTMERARPLLVGMFM